MLPLLTTLADIILLRKGPEAIPRSGLLFAIAVGLWLLSSLAGTALIDRIDEDEFLLGLYSALAGILMYSVVLVASGRAERLLQTLSAIIGCGALIFLVFVAEYVLFTPFVGERLTWIGANLILLWSVPVEGHIIARAIDQHWYIGIVIAISVFVLQLILYSYIASANST